jgi:hypothetical protein
MTEQSTSTRYVNPVTFFFYDLGELAVGDLFDGDLPEAFSAGDHGIFYRLTPVMYAYLRVVVMGIKANVERGGCPRTLYDTARKRFLAHHSEAEALYGLPALKSEAERFYVKAFALPRSVGDWGRKVGPPRDPLTPELPKGVESPAEAPQPRAEIPGDPATYAERLERCKATLGAAGRDYPPGCLHWFKTTHPGEYAELSSAEMSLEEAVSRGTPSTTEVAAKELLSRWRAAFALFEAAFALEVCDRCGGQQRALTPCEPPGKKICRYCVAELTRDPLAGLPSTTSGKLALADVTR